MKKIILPIAFLLTLMLTTPTIAQPTIDSTWVVMHGCVKTYGVNPAYGWCGAYAKIGKWAHAFVAWIPSKPLIGVIFNFYAARLVNTTLVELRSGALYIEGLWDVYNVTIIYEPREPGEVPTPPKVTIELLVDDGGGTLSVTDDLKNFTVDIVDPVELISGVVKFYAIRSIEIPIGDCSCKQAPGVPDGRIDLYDLVHVAKAYGSTPMASNFETFFSMDFDFDFKVGLCELTTIAANLDTVY